jgi:ATP adenylyltransferase
MERMWSPWRSQYMGSFKESKQSNKTFITQAIESNDDIENLVVYRFDYCIVLMNKYPYNSGHILIAPYREVNDILLLEDNEYTEINKVLKICIKAINNVYKPHGYNLGVNSGIAAGAGVPTHLHYHIVPRWNGDSNFMPTIADIKVMSETLEDSREKLHNEIKNIILNNE